MLEPEAKAKAKEEVNTGDESIKDDLEFAGWYERLEDQLLDASLDEYTYVERLDRKGLFRWLMICSTHLNELRHTERYLDAVAASTDATLDLLSTLYSSFRNVGAQTSAFRQQCQDLVDEQTRLESLADGIGQNLLYYSYLEPITRKLNAPGAGNFVRGKEFSDMLGRLDECLEYMNNHVCWVQPPSWCELLMWTAQSTRGIDLQVTVSATADARTHAHPCQLHWRPTRHRCRCVKTHCRQATQRHDHVRSALRQVPRGSI